MLTRVEVRFHSPSRAETDCFDSWATRGGGGRRGEPLVSAEVEVDATGGVGDRTGLRTGTEEAEVGFDGGLRGRVLVSGELMGFLRGEPGPSFLRKRPTVVVPGLAGGDAACTGDWASAGAGYSCLPPPTASGGTVCNGGGLGGGVPGSVVGSVVVDGVGGDVAFVAAKNRRTPSMKNTCLFCRWCVKRT